MGAGVAEVQSGQVSRKLAEGVIASSVLVDGDRLLVGSFDQGVAEIDLSLSGRAGATWREEPEETRALVELEVRAFAIERHQQRQVAVGAQRRDAELPEIGAVRGGVRGSPVAGMK